MDVEDLLLGPPGVRCPDLTPLDFFFWVKDRVYNTTVNEIDHLKDKSKRL